MITQEYLKERFNYAPGTGVLTWRPLTGRLTKAMRAFNTRWAGKEAGTTAGSDGRRRVRIHKRVFLAHRLIWLIVYGSWPTDQIDHINGDHHDNRLRNLRDVTQFTNQRNRKCHRKWGVAE